MQFEAVTHKNQQLNVDLHDCYLKIEDMKKVKSSIEEELLEMKSKEEVYMNYHAQKEKEVGDLTEKVE